MTPKNIERVENFVTVVVVIINIRQLVDSCWFNTHFCRQGFGSIKNNHLVISVIAYIEILQFFIVIAIIKP